VWLNALECDSYMGKLKKIPYGISDYKTIVAKGYLYVDKTKYIELLEESGEPFVFFLRPRRFGKSLFTSVLEYYYDMNSKKEFETLFRDTYIGGNSTKERNSYYILKFNFSGINTSTKEMLLNGFTVNVLKGLHQFEKKYSLNLEYKKEGMPSEIFNSFLGDVQEKINKRIDVQNKDQSDKHINDSNGHSDGRIYVIIDEYDHFANELLSYQVDVFEETVSRTGFVRKWYEVLKIGTDNGLIQRIYGTGVSPVTLDSLTSGFNISMNLTRDLDLNECLGFTESEVRSILNETLGDSIEIDKEMPVLRKYYNGYLFSKDAKNRVFNSDMVLYYAARYKKDRKPPEELIDTNVSSDYNKMANMFTLKNRERNLKILEEIINDKEQSTLITAEFSLAKDFTKDDFNSLLFYLGFLTIKEGVLNASKLIVPNYVIKELYFDFFGKILTEKANYDLDVADIRESIEELALKGEINQFINIITTTLKKLSNRDYVKFDEKYIKVIMTTYFMMSRIYYVKNEYEVENGYIDIALLPRAGINAKYYAVFEVKYIKKEEYSDKKLHEKIDEARKEMAGYAASNELTELSNLRKWILVFCKDEPVYVKVIE
jgi:hypothetical protein